jgi:hypothetical protein
LENASDSREFIPQESDIVAEINREAEKNFNSVWQAIERIQSNQVTDREILSNSAEELTAATFVGFAKSPISSSRSCLTLPATRRKSYCE